jgi:Na+-translocating ferredoxin:NAD+ oxidoreductase RnfD subunit
MLVIWVLGGFIVWRLRRLHITATYVVAFLCFAIVRSAIEGSPWQSEIAPLTGPMYQLFIFFMITDPKTTVQGLKAQCAVAFVVAAVEMILRLCHVIYAPYYALFMVGPAALLIEMWVRSHRERAPVGVLR